LDGRRFQPIHAIQERKRFFGPGAALDGGGQQAPGGVRFAALEGLLARVDELLGFALAFRDGAARALDVGTRPRVAAIEKEDARPDVDGQLVFAGEVVIQPAEQQLLDPRVAIALRHLRLRRHGVGEERLCHRKWQFAKKFRRL